MKTISRFQTEIAKLEIHKKLNETPNKDPHYNHEILSTLLQNAKSKHIPKRISKFNKRRHKKQKWMTDELLAQIVIKNKMYVDWKTTPDTHTDHERVKPRFKEYEKLVLKGIEKAKREYFTRVFTAYRSDMKKYGRLLMKH